MTINATQMPAGDPSLQPDNSQPQSTAPVAPPVVPQQSAAPAPNPTLAPTAQPSSGTIPGLSDIPNAPTPPDLSKIGQVNWKGAGVKSILGQVLVGALSGAAAGVAGQAPEGAVGKGAAFSAGAKAASDAAQKKIADAKAAAQQNYENERARISDLTQHNIYVANQYDLAKRLQMDTEKTSAYVKGQDAETQEAMGRIHNMNDARDAANQGLVAILNEAQINPNVTATNTKQLHPHAGALSNGTQLPVVTKDPSTDQVTARLYSVADLDQPVTTQVQIPHWDGHSLQDNGDPVLTYSVITPDGKTTYRQVAEQIQALQGQYKAASDRIISNRAKLAETNKTNADIEETNAKSNLEKAQAAALNMSSPVTMQTAQQLVEGQEDPSQLPKRSKDYNSIVAAANDYSMKKYGKPFNVAQASIDYKYASNPQTQNTLKYLNSVIPNMADLVKQSNAIPRTQLPALNDVAAWGRKNTGSPQMAAYDATVTEVADQIAKILQGGGSGNGSTDAKLKQAQDLFNHSFTTDQVVATVGELSKLLDTRKAALIGNNRYLQQQFGVSQPQAQAKGNQAMPQSSDPFFNK